jgi:hypothetical protein
MDPRPWKREFHNSTNPDHTGWAFAGLVQAERDSFKLEEEDPQGVKRLFYVLLLLRRLPFRHLHVPKPPERGPYPYVVRPGQLHRKEGKEATLFRFRSLLYHISHPGIEFSSMENFRIYPFQADIEIPPHATFDEILQGKFGRMDKNHPLRVVYIPGKAGRKPQNFPQVSFICRWFSRKGTCGSHNEEEIASMDDEVGETHAGVDNLDLPPTYEEAVRYDYSQC